MAANKANNQARQEAVERSRNEAKRARAEKDEAKRARANKANNQARQEAVERSRNEADAARRAKRAAEAEAARTAAEAAAAMRAQANALIRNVKKQWRNVGASNMSRNEKKKKGAKVYRAAASKLHPNKGGNTERFQVFSSAYEKFKNNVNQN